MGFQSAVTTITRNFIPWWLRQPAVALIGENCYVVLVEDFDISHGECLRHALSKGLGFGIVVGGSIVKIPQILKIMNTNSARGLSLSAYILETAAYAISLAYSWRGGFPFSTYGENFFITIQNIIITLMILHYSIPRGSYTGIGSGSVASPHSQNRSRVVVGGIVITLSCLFLFSDTLCSRPLLSFLQLTTIPIGILSKAPQILENHSNRSTGNLSAFAVFSALAGCLARLFTTKQEVKDPLVFWGFAGAAFMNVVLAFQMVLYWQNPDERQDTKHKLTGGVAVESKID